MKSRSWASTGLVVLHLGYAYTLWEFFRLYHSSDYFFERPRDGSYELLFLVLAGGLFLYCWALLVRKPVDSGSRTGVWLPFASGLWVGAATAVYLTYAILSAVAIR